MDKYLVLYDSDAEDTGRAYSVLIHQSVFSDPEEKCYYYIRNVSLATAKEIAEAMNAKERHNDR